MALQTSGDISLNDVNVELGVGGTSIIGMNDANVRSLFQVVSGAISMSDGYGRSALAKLYIAATTTEINLRSWAIANGWPGTGAVEIYVNSGVWVYSDTAAVPAITIDGNWPLGLTLINNGIIMGMGGSGNGSAAISTSISYTMYATNYILGGGGRGGADGGGGAGGGNSTGAGVGVNSNNVTTSSAAGGRNPLGSNTPNSVINGKGNYIVYGGGAGGGGNCSWDCQNWQSRGGYGGGNANAGGAYASVQGSPAGGWGGGGGYGAAGGTGRSGGANVGGYAGGRGILLNGHSVTWPNGQPNALIRGGVGN